MASRQGQVFLKQVHGENKLPKPKNVFNKVYPNSCCFRVLQSVVSRFLIENWTMTTPDNPPTIAFFRAAADDGKVYWQDLQRLRSLILSCHVPAFWFHVSSISFHLFSGLFGYSLKQSAIPSPTCWLVYFWFSFLECDASDRSTSNTRDHGATAPATVGLVLSKQLAVLDGQINTGRLISVYSWRKPLTHFASLR